MKFQKHFFNLGVALFLFASLLSGCGDGSDSPTPITPTPITQTVLLDASAGGSGAAANDPLNKYTYFNLSTGQVAELADADALTSLSWDIAFKRSKVKLNSGLSGPKGVGGFFTGNNAEAYGADGKPVLAWFQLATADTELSDLTAVTAANIPTDPVAFTADKLVPAIQGDGTSNGWWLYDATTHIVSANAANWWVVKSAGGNSYAKFHATAIQKLDTDGDGVKDTRQITLEWLYQGSTETAFGATLQTHLIQVPVSGGSQYLDFDTHMADSDPAGVAGWDMKIEYDGTTQEYRITLNGGVSGTGQAAAFGPTTTPATYTSGGSPSPVPHYTKDSTGGIFVDSSWYAYNLTGTDHKLWPNYRVYLIQSGTEVFKLQILLYYHPETATSGWYTFRFEKIAP